MREETLKKSIALLTKAYPASRAIQHLDDDFVKIWWQQLKHLADAPFLTAIQRWIRDNEYFPTIAGILQSQTIQNWKRELEYQKSRTQEPPQLGATDKNRERDKNRAREVLKQLTHGFKTP